MVNSSWIPHIHNIIPVQRVQKFLSEQDANVLEKQGRQSLEKLTQQIGNITLSDIAEKVIKKGDYSLSEIFLQIGKGEVRAENILEQFFSEEEIMFSAFSLTYPKEDTFLLRLHIVVENTPGILGKTIQKIYEYSGDILNSTSSLEDDHITCYFTIRIPTAFLFFEMIHGLSHLPELVTIEKL